MSSGTPLECGNYRRYPSARRLSRGSCERQIEKSFCAIEKMNGKQDKLSPCSSQTTLVVILLPQVSDQVFAHHPSQRVFQLHRLDKQVVLGIKARSCHRRLEVEAQPLLNALHSRALCKVQEKNQIQNDRSREDRVAAQEVHFDLHRIPEPAEDVDVVPAFFVVTARRVVVDAHLVVHLAVEHRIKLRL